jgi:hypothetical protein
VHRAGRGLVLELSDGRHDPAPGYRAVIFAGERELVSPRGAFLERLVTLALEHQLRRSPDVDFGDHREKVLVAVPGKGRRRG